jgi:hypothetical protein
MTVTGRLVLEATTLPPPPDLTRVRLGLVLARPRQPFPSRGLRPRGERAPQKPIEVASFGLPWSRYLRPVPGQFSGCERASGGADSWRSLKSIRSASTALGLMGSSWTGTWCQAVRSGISASTCSGELVYQLKYRTGDPNDIVETAVAFITERWSGAIDCVVPPPPSLHRTKQPAVLIAEGIATSLRTK